MNSFFYFEQLFRSGVTMLEGLVKKLFPSVSSPGNIGHYRPHLFVFSNLSGTQSFHRVQFELLDAQPVVFTFLNDFT